MIYLIFNEGYAAASGEHLVRRDLCAEAIRLGRVLSDLLPGEAGKSRSARADAAARFAARDACQRGRLVTLEEQDRSRWDQAQIREGLRLVETALRRGPWGRINCRRPLRRCHAEAKTAQDTDWHQIARLYEKLLEFNGSAVIALNHAVAVAMSSGLEDGLARMESLELDHYYLFHAARADILRRMHRPQEAIEAYRKALALAANRVEQEFLEGRIAAFAIV